MCKLIDYIDYRNSTCQSIFNHFNQGQFFNYYSDAKETFSVQQDENWVCISDNIPKFGMEECNLARRMQFGMAECNLT